MDSVLRNIFSRRTLRQLGNKTIRLISLLAFVSILLTSCKESLTPVLTVEGGKVQGVEMDNSVLYCGVPYAAAPIGERRWQKPQPVEPWQGVWMSNKPESSDEDCLYLCISTPKGASAHPERKLPVVVKLGCDEGCCKDSCRAEQEADVVFVSVSSRRGIYGYLCHPLLSEEDEDGVSGNYGVWDQVKALEWVQTYISQFGGDPMQMTVKGGSIAPESLPQDALDAPGEDMFSIAGVYSLEEMRALSIERVAEVMANYEAVQKRQLITRPHTDGAAITEETKCVTDVWQAKQNKTYAEK